MGDVSSGVSTAYTRAKYTFSGYNPYKEVASFYTGVPQDQLTLGDYAKGMGTAVGGGAFIGATFGLPVILAACSNVTPTDVDIVIQLGEGVSDGVEVDEAFELEATVIKSDVPEDELTINWYTKATGGDKALVDGNEIAKSFSFGTSGTWIVMSEAVYQGEVVGVAEPVYISVNSAETSTSGTINVGVAGPHTVEPEEEFALTATLTRASDSAPELSSLSVEWENSCDGPATITAVEDDGTSSQTFSVGGEATCHIYVSAINDEGEDVTTNAPADHYVNVVASAEDTGDTGDEPTLSTMGLYLNCYGEDGVSDGEIEEGETLTCDARSSKNDTTADLPGETDLSDGSVRVQFKLDSEAAYSDADTQSYAAEQITASTAFSLGSDDTISARVVWDLDDNGIIEEDEVLTEWNRTSGTITVNPAEVEDTGEPATECYSYGDPVISTASVSYSTLDDGDLGSLSYIASGEEVWVEVSTTILDCDGNPLSDASQISFVGADTLFWTSGTGSAYDWSYNYDTATGELTINGFLEPSATDNTFTIWAEGADGRVAHKDVYLTSKESIALYKDDDHVQAEDEITFYLGGESSEGRSAMETYDSSSPITYYIWATASGDTSWSCDTLSGGDVANNYLTCTMPTGADTVQVEGCVTSAIFGDLCSTDGSFDTLTVSVSER